MWLSKSAMQAVTRLDAVGRKSMSVSAAVASKKYAVGQGIVKVTRKKGATLRDMGAEAIQKALADAGVDKKEVSALFVGNMMSGMLSDQQHLGPFLATAAGLGSVDTMTTEACCGAGGAALRMAYTALQSGMHDTVVVAGVEQMTHMDREKITKSLATASDWDLEGSRGASFASLNAKLMKLYIETYGIDRSKFAPFALTAHSNALTSEHATLRKPQSEADYESSAILSDPVRILDASPTCDGAAAVVLTTRKDIASNVSGRRQVVLAGSGAGSDILAVDHRPEPLKLRAVEKSTEEALKRAGITQGNVDIFELHDAYSIMACLCLESAGFAMPGEGTSFAQDGHLSLRGLLPIATFGGLKARGHPVGATGVYQAAEMVVQLRGEAGANQVKGAEVAVSQNVGGAGSSVFTHVFVRE